MVAVGRVVSSGGSPHTHPWADITGEPATFPPDVHGHVIADSTGLQAALDDKASASHVHEPEGPTFLRPEHNGLISATQPIATVPNTVVLASGVLYVVKLPLRKAITLSQLWVATSATASGLTAGQCFLAIFTPDGVRRAVSASVHATIGAAANYGIPMVTPYAASAGWVWGAILINGTTPPTLRSGGSAPAQNLNLVPAQYNFGRALTGQTSIPASFDPSTIANIQSGESLWMGVS